MIELTETQTKIVEFIRQYLAKEGYPPTRSEIADEMGYKSITAAQEALQAIEAKGMITLKPGVSRGIRLLA